MNLKNKSELEKYFADHFDTVLFPVLADIYKSEGDLTRARKVCEIGLEYHPNNVDGSFVLAEINQSTGDLNVAEKLFKNVIAIEPNHYKAALGLAKIQLKLKRAPDSIAKLWMKIAKIDPTHPDVKIHLKQSLIQKKDSSKDKEIVESKKLKKEFDKINQKVEKTPAASSKKKPKKSSIVKPAAGSKVKVEKTPNLDTKENAQAEQKILGPKPPSIKPQKINEEEFQSLDISPRMATFTMVNVLKKQKLYQQAIAVLSLLEEKGADPALISQERQNLQKLIKDNEPR
jgi:tetratricopeptide (TPR) repeat protein